MRQAGWARVAIVVLVLATVTQAAYAQPGPRLADNPPLPQEQHPGYAFLFALGQWWALLLTGGFMVLLVAVTARMYFRTWTTTDPVRLALSDRWCRAHLHNLESSAEAGPTSSDKEAAAESSSPSS
jgi:hypothetical protein